jgi:hypothetical protein
MKIKKIVREFGENVKWHCTLNIIVEQYDLNDLVCIKYAQIT